jgi:hypothetical protein
MLNFLSLPQQSSTFFLQSIAIYHQNIQQFDLAVIVLEARSNRLADLKPLAPKILEVLGEAAKGQTTLVTM